MNVMNRIVGAMLMPDKEIVSADGKAPITVQKAIDLAKARKTEIDANKKESESRSRLMHDRNVLVECKNNLHGNDYGMPAEKKDE